MAMSRKSRRAVLAGVALVLLAGNLWWFTRPAPVSAPIFELGADTGRATVSAQRVPELPRFDAARGDWRVSDRPIGSIAARIERFTPAGAGVRDGFVTVALERGASAEDMRRMLLSLLDTGICAVGVVQDGEPAAADGSHAVPVQRIVSVRGQDGARVLCVPRDQSAAAASSASR
ncbi:hypothetical protein MTR62_07260 [Novosphingobium sp. 1949]|uniref:Uncharacterized protein n=1 Tax=Novosphingobium organovorum TaxID=2930092 RepID=A0ABT0BCE0_9SPHN|nr:hypothetical protein [Novosphingobium organovorum]MCJ2182489.1 hypothetical protein [Novosphingobium organovorum]